MSIESLTRHEAVTEIFSLLNEKVQRIVRSKELSDLLKNINISVSRTDALFGVYLTQEEFKVLQENIFFLTNGELIALIVRLREMRGEINIRIVPDLT